MSDPRISVVIPTCDRPAYLREAVASVLAQTLPAHEIIIVDNGREPADTAQLPPNAKLRVVRALPRFGVSQARNLGAVLSTGDYIAFLDDDDWWEESYLEAVRSTAEETGADIILGRLRDGETGSPIKAKQAEFSDRKDLIRQILRRNPGAGGSSTTVVRSWFMASTGYDPWLTTGQDKALVLDLLLKGAKPARASGGWVRFRNDGEGPRQTEVTKRAEGKSRFLRKYWQQMTGRDRIFGLAQLVRLQLWRLTRKS